MLLALPQLAAAGFDVNAHGCRQFDEALALLSGLAHARQLPHLVVIALGGDGSVTPADVAETLQILGRGRELVLVTPRELGGGSGSDAETVRASGRQRPSQVHVLDWVRESEGHSAWFQPDGLHLTFSGADAFTRFLRHSFAYAAPTTRPLACPRGSDPPGAQLTPSSPLVHAQVRAGVLHVDQIRETTKLTLLNENAFTVFGLARLYPTVHRGGSAPADQLLAQACVALGAGTSGTLTLPLTTYGSELLTAHQRLGVRLVLTIEAPTAGPVKTGGILLERPRHR